MARKALRAAIHESTAYRAERVLHPIASGNGITLLEAGEFVFAYDVTFQPSSLVASLSIDTYLVYASDDCL